MKVRIAMQREYKNQVVHGYTAINAASFIILNLSNIDSFDVIRWVEYDEVNIIEKCYKPQKKPYSMTIYEE